MASDGDVREASEAKRTLILSEQSERGIWSVAARFTSVGEAAIARSALDVAGIDTYLADSPDSLGVMVHVDDVERARAVIHASALNTRDEIEVSTCSECGSPDLRPIPRVRTLLLLSTVLFGIGIAVGQMIFAAICLIAVVAGVFMMPTHRCGNCGWTSTPFLKSSRRAPLPDRPDLVERPCPRCGALMQRRRCETCGFKSR